MTVEITQDREKIDKIFRSGDVAARTGFEADHAAPANYGTRAHWPPLTPLLGWTNRMGWNNPGLDESMSEDELWDEVNRRRRNNESLPAAFLLAFHISQHGTNGLLFATDAIAYVQRNGESWIEQQGYDDETPLEQIVEDVAEWSLEEATERLRNRVSRAATGELEASAFGPELIGDE